MAPKPEEVVVNGISITLKNPEDLPAPTTQTAGLTANIRPVGTAFVNNAFYNDDGSAAVCPITSAEQKRKQAEAEAAAQAVATVDEPPHMDFDDLLPHIGEFGTYQKMLFLLMIPFAFSVAFVYFTQIFLTLVPEEHWCRVPELEHLSLEDRLELGIPMYTDGRSKCTMYAVNFTELMETHDMLMVDPSWPIQPCIHGWEYDRVEVPYSTIATENDWVCDDAVLPAFAQAIFFIGAVVGGLLFGWIADRFGRIPSLMGCNLLGFVFGVATAFTGSFWWFSFCRFMLGFAFDNCFMMMYILVLEYVGPKWRTFVANMSIALFFTFAACILPWIALWLNDWRMLAVVTSLPLVLAIGTPWLIPESARWLVSQGKIERAIGILKRFERINKRHVAPQVYQDFRTSCVKMQAEEAEHSNYSIMDLFKTPHLRKITLLLIVIWMLISLVFDGHIRNVGALGLNVFVTFTVAAATECPADIILTLTLDRWGRRWLAFGTMVLSGLFSIVATAFPIGIYSAIMAIMGRFCVNFSYNIGLQYAAELLPTVVRAQGVAFIHIMGYVASIIAPFVVYLGMVTPELPLLTLGCFGILGGVLSLFLPETMDKELPQTLMDGERFGVDQRIWDLPCKSNKNSDPEKTSPIPSNFVRGSATGASLRASTRGELGSTMLQRSARSRKSNKAAGDAKV